MKMERGKAKEKNGQCGTDKREREGGKRDGERDGMKGHSYRDRLIDRETYRDRHGEIQRVIIQMSLFPFIPELTLYRLFHTPNLFYPLFCFFLHSPFVFVL